MAAKCPFSGDAEDASLFDDLSEDGPEFPLPEGIKKEILFEAATSEWKQPKAGDQVTVHFVASVGGQEIRSTREEGEAVTLLLGQGDAVCPGLQLGIPTMRRGELARFSMTPEYGKGTLEPKAPNSTETFVYEVELVAWKAKVDLFEDRTVLKTVEQEGSGWKLPKSRDEVGLALRIARNGQVLKELHHLEYTLGSAMFSGASVVIDRCLRTMKRGEVAELQCSRALDLGAGPQKELQILITLKEIHETRDVSFAKDKSLMKKQVVEGQSIDTPKDGSNVSLILSPASCSQNVAFESKVLNFVCGDGEVPDALEFAVAEMKKGEKAILTVKQPTDLAADLGIDAGEELAVSLMLEDFEQVPLLGSSPEDNLQRLARARQRKEVGTRLFKAQRYALAVLRYKSAADLLSYVEHFEPEAKSQAQDLKLTCELNRAACDLKLQRYKEAKVACQVVLQSQPENIKALFRRAQAELGLKNFSEGVADCKKVLQLDAENRDAKVLLRQALASQKEAEKKYKAVYASMCKALGKENEPQPAKPVPEVASSLREREVPRAGVISTVLQGMSRAFLFFPNLVFSNFSLIFGRFWHLVTGKRHGR